MSALTILLKEFRYLEECKSKGCMVAPCRVSYDEMNIWNWDLSFDITVDGTVVETVGYLLHFPTNYPFSPPAVLSRNPDYYGFRFCLKEGWRGFPSIQSIIAHIYLSITDPDYYHNRGYNAPKSSPPQPSPENKEVKE